MECVRYGEIKERVRHMTKDDEICGKVEEYLAIRRIKTTGGVGMEHKIGVPHG